MRAAGMMSIDEAVQKHPINPFEASADIRDLQGFHRWLKLELWETQTALNSITQSAKDDILPWLNSKLKTYQEIMEMFETESSAMNNEEMPDFERWLGDHYRSILLVQARETLEDALTDTTLGRSAAIGNSLANYRVATGQINIRERIKALH